MLTSRPEPDWQRVGSQGELEVRRELGWIPERVNPLRLLTLTRSNRAAVRRAVREFRPDVVYCHGIDGVGFEVYHTATHSGLPSLSTLGDAWLAFAWRDLIRFDPWTAVASGRTGRGVKLPGI